MPDFLDTLKEGLGKGMSTLGTKSKELLDSNRVKSQISDLERQKKDSLVELGTAVCLMLDENQLNPDLLRVKRATIADIDKQIKAKQDELELIHAQAQQALGIPKQATKCSCGVDIPAGAKFCISCDRKIEATGASA